MLIYTIFFQKRKYIKDNRTKINMKQDAESDDFRISSTIKSSKDFQKKRYCSVKKRSQRLRQNLVFGYSNTIQTQSVVVGNIFGVYLIERIYLMKVCTILNQWFRSDFGPCLTLVISKILVPLSHVIFNSLHVQNLMQFT